MSPVTQLNLFAEIWLSSICRASWQGGIALLVVWGTVRAFPRIPASAKVWLWRLAYLKALFALSWATPIDIPLLPASSAPSTLAAQIDARPPAAPPAQASPLQPVTSHQPSAALSFAGYLLIFWLLGIIGYGLRFVHHWRRAMCLRRSASPLNSLPEHCLVLAGMFKLKAIPQILETSQTSRPLLVGMFRPAILLPKGAVDRLEPVQLRMILAHEIAHLQRRDLRWMTLFSLGEGLFFFHPLLWLVRQEWLLAQEMACDEWVLRLTGTSASDYGSMLLEVLAQSRQTRQAGFHAVGIIETKQTLKRRLLAMKQITPGSPGKLTLTAMALLLIAAISILPWRLVAQNPDTPEDVTKLKEENARLRAELDRAKAQSEVARQETGAWERVVAQLRATQKDLQQQLEKLPTEFGDFAAVDKLRAQLKSSEEQIRKSLEKYTEAHPVVRQEIAKLEALQRSLYHLTYSLTAPGRKKTTAAKAGFAERELLLQELKLVEQDADLTRKRFEAGTATRDELLRVQREVFGIKQQLAALESSKAEQRELIQAQIKLLEQQSAEAQKRVHNGVNPPGSEIPFEREILRLRREQLSLESLPPP